MPEGSTDQAVISEAIWSETQLPLGHHARNETPYQFRNRLHQATVKTFDEG
jgi:hypothetical protein